MTGHNRHHPVPVGRWERRHDLDLFNRPAWVIETHGDVVRINQSSGEVLITNLETELEQLNQRRAECAADTSVRSADPAGVSDQ